LNRELPERVARAMERVLALAFIGAVCLNFANVVGRYGFGYSIAAADEVQIYVMVYMAFAGAAIVSWRGQHLRMDVLATRLPAAGRRVLAWAECVLAIVLAGFVVVQSSRYSWQMFALDRRSDNGDIPAWIPHAAVAIGFALVGVAVLLRIRKK
jgi:TRAP-type C4-dicarboxylate transport system permease small subunit